jgi:hypothetical protein
VLIAEDGGTFRMTIEPGPEQVRVSWTITQGDGATALTESESFLAPSVDEARRWAHSAARVRGFKTIRVKKPAAAAS